MADTLGTHWHPMAAYLYVLYLDDPALAWEYLRRNPDYRRDWLLRPDVPQAAHRWGLRLLEDPSCDARDAQPDWLTDPDRLVQLCAPADTSTGSGTFDLWRLPGRKRLTHDGDRLALTCELAGHVLRGAISTALADGMAYAYAVRAGSRLGERWRAIEGDLARNRCLAGVLISSVDRAGRSAAGYPRSVASTDAA